MKAIVTVGLPGCGKSTFAAQKIDAQAASPFAELNLDALRERVSGDATNQSATGAAIDLRNRLLNTYALKGRSVIISDTHARKRHRNRLLRILRKLGYKIEIVFFDVGPGTCKRRNAGRERRVPDEAIDAMAESLREFPPTARDADHFQVVREAADPLLPAPQTPQPA
jgi:predicted kinase